MTPDAPGGRQLARARARVHRHRLADDEAVGHELADRLARVGIADFVDLVRVQPDLAAAAADDGGGEALLGAEVDPESEERLAGWAVLGYWGGWFG